MGALRISKPLAGIIGLVTLWPLVHICLFVAMMVLAESLPKNDPHLPIFGSFGAMLIAQLMLMLLSLGLLAFYARHLFTNPALSTERRILWLLLLLFTLPGSALVYWWLYVWHTPVELQPAV